MAVEEDVRRINCGEVRVLMKSWQMPGMRNAARSRNR